MDFAHARTAGVNFVAIYGYARQTAPHSVAVVENSAKRTRQSFFSRQLRFDRQEMESWCASVL